MADLHDQAVHDYVYRAFFTSNSTSKQTSAGRFRDLDRVAISIAGKHNLNVIHDIGVSSGVTSLDLYRTLATASISTRFCISDKYGMYGAAGRFPSFILDSERSVVELYFCGILGRQDVTPKYPVTKLLYRLLAHRRVPEPIRWFPVFDREVLQHIERGLIHRIDYDVFATRMPDTFTFVRCMNLLNLSYFDPAAIEVALRNIVQSLKDGGVLQIGRTHEDGSNHATFYGKRTGRLEPLQEVGTGTEIADIVAKL
jgi:hypothetical protein